MNHNYKDDIDYAQDYYRYFQSKYKTRIEHFPGYPQPADYPVYSDYVNAINPFLTENYYDSLLVYHDAAREFADGVGYTSTNKPFLVPGTYSFDTAFASVISKKSFSEGGSRFYDKSALYHVQGEYRFNTKYFDLITGANGRLYRPNSQGTIFSDTSGKRITNREYGLYGGIEKKFYDERLNFNFTLRMDKNENFDYLFSPAASVVYELNKKHIFRASVSSAIRNPTLTDQYLYYNVGRAILVGNTTGYDSLVTIPSLFDYLYSGSATKLQYFNVAPVRPEEVKTIEAGYRGTVLKNMFVDVVCYYSWYKNFIGYKIGADIIPVQFSPIINNVYRVAANSVDRVTTRGLSAGINYYLGKFYMIYGNYSYNLLDRGGGTDPLIPAFNTPENKFNTGISGRDIDAYLFRKIHLKNFGFSINYKWVQGFQYEGSPQFTGYVPRYDFVDAQLNYRVKKINTVFKIGASNLLDNRKFTVYGGPTAGRLAYFSVLVELIGR